LWTWRQVGSLNFSPPFWWVPRPCLRVCWEETGLEVEATANASSLSQTRTLSAFRLRFLGLSTFWETILNIAGYVSATERHKKRYPLDMCIRWCQKALNPID
jgi:hypothetical protein